MIMFVVTTQPNDEQDRTVLDIVPNGLRGDVLTGWMG